MEIQGHGVMVDVQGVHQRPAVSSGLSVLVKIKPKVQPGDFSHVISPWWPRNKENFPEFGQPTGDINYGLHGVVAGSIRECRSK